MCRRETIKLEGLRKSGEPVVHACTHACCLGSCYCIIYAFPRKREDRASTRVVLFYFVLVWFVLLAPGRVLCEVSRQFHCLSLSLSLSTSTYAAFGRLYSVVIVMLLSCSAVPRPALWFGTIPCLAPRISKPLKYPKRVRVHAAASLGCATVLRPSFSVLSE